MTNDPLEQKLNSLQFPAPSPTVDKAVIAAAANAPLISRTARPTKPIWLLLAFAAATLLAVLANLPSDTDKDAPKHTQPRMAADETGEEQERSWGTTVEGVRCSIQLDAKSYYPHQLIHLDYALENTRNSVSPFFIGRFYSQPFAGGEIPVAGPNAEIHILKIESKNSIPVTGITEHIPAQADRMLDASETESGSFLLQVSAPGKYSITMKRGEASSNTVLFNVALPADKDWADPVGNLRVYQRTDKKTYAPGEIVYFHWLVENLSDQENTSFEGSMYSYWDDTPRLSFTNGFKIKVLLDQNELEHNDLVSSEWRNSANYLDPHELRGGLVPLNTFWQLDRAGKYQASIDSSATAMGFSVEIPANWPWGDLQNSLRAHAHTDKKSYAPGEPIFVTMVVHNNGASDAVSDGFIEKCSNGVALVNEAAISITSDADSAPVQQIGSVKRHCDDYITAPTLPAGTFKTVTINLTQYWKLDTPGSYTLTFHMGSPESNAVTFIVGK